MNQYQEAIELLNSLVKSFESINIEPEIQSDDKQCQCSKHENIYIDALLPAEVYAEEDDEIIDENCSEYSHDTNNPFENDIDLHEILPGEIYDESSSVQYDEQDLNEYSQSDHIFDEILPDEIYSVNDNNIVVTQGNAAIIAGPALIDIDGIKAIITYPFPCKIIQRFDDTQLGVRLAFPYNNVIQKLPHVLIEQKQNQIDIIEQEYLDKLNCDDLGYKSIKQIQSVVFQ